jgi:hypothetical protein
MAEIDSKWKSIYKIGGMSAFILLVYSLVTMVFLFVIGGQPETAQEGFEMLQANRLVGLLRLDMLTIFAMPLYYLLILGLYIALKRTQSILAIIGALLGWAGVTLLLATPSAFSFMYLSDRFALASGEAYKSLFLAAGEALLASDLWHGSGARMGGLLLQTALLLLSIAMLQSHIFSRATAWVGVVTHGLDLLHILVGFVSPAVGASLMFVAGPMYLIWFPLLGRDFFRLARRTEKSEPEIA